MVRKLISQSSGRVRCEVRAVGKNTKNDRVHMEGIRRRFAYFSLKIRELCPLSQNIASLGGSEDNSGTNERDQA
jgi:hypothetical protein